MDFTECTRIVFNKIQKIEPENVTKIIGYLLLQDDGDQEIIRLALAPDQLIHEVIYKAKTELQQFTNKSRSPPVSTSVNPTFNPLSSHVSLRPLLSPTTFHVPSSPYWDSQQANKQHSDFISLGYTDSALELQNQTQLLSLEDQVEPVTLGISGFSNDGYYPARRSQCFSSSLPEFPVKTCHYFNKGFCKHGRSCRYLHGQVIPDSTLQMYGNDGVNEDQIFSPGSLEKLEMEIVEILKVRKGNPISIASLPMIYYEKYGKVLQAEGYLTESQRHGKAGYSLTKLLARLKNSIRLIDRPHGQHAVILAEDAPKYMENRNDRSDPGPIVSGSRQIYLTFPAESTFTEDDVSNYFNTFGPVEDVRIPCQQKRMFGFVTFVGADAVKMILAKGNPHFVCGARVLVKPYREKSKLVDRKYQDRFEPHLYYSSHYADLESEIQSIRRGYETSRLLKSQIMDEQEQALEVERRHLAELHLVRKPLSSQSYFGYSMDGLKDSEDQFNFPSTEQFNYLLDVLNSGSANDDKRVHTDAKYTDLESSQGLNLPESPFATSVASGISTVI